MTLRFLKISRQIVPAERVRVLSSCRNQCGCPRVSDVRAVSLGATSPALSRSASGCFPPDGIARFYPAQLFVQARRGTRTFSAQTKEWQCLLLKESQPGSKEGMTAVFFGMPHWQFNDWAVADGTMQRCCLSSCFNSLHQSLNKCRHNLFPGTFFAFKVDIHPHSFVNSGTMNANFK